MKLQNLFVLICCLGLISSCVDSVRDPTNLAQTIAKVEAEAAKAKAEADKAKAEAAKAKADAEKAKADAAKAKADAAKAKADAAKAKIEREKREQQNQPPVGEPPTQPQPCTGPRCQELRLFKEHLEFTGYKCKEPEKISVYCSTSSNRPNFRIKKQNEGWLLVAYFGTTEKGKRNRAALLNLMNKTNEVAISSRFYLDKDGDVVMETWFAGAYNRENFGLVLDRFSKDFAKFISNNKDALDGLMK